MSMISTVYGNMITTVYGNMITTVYGNMISTVYGKTLREKLLCLDWKMIIHRNLHSSMLVDLHYQLTRP